MVLVIGLAAPLGEVRRAVTDTHTKGDVVKSHVDHGDVEASDGIVALSETVYAGTPRFVAQYGAPIDTFFTRVVARSPRGD